MSNWTERVEPNEQPECIGDILARALSAEVTNKELAVPIRGLYEFSFKKKNYFADLDIDATVKQYTDANGPLDPIFYESLLRQEKSKFARCPLPLISKERVTYENVLDLAIFVANRMAIDHGNIAKFSADFSHIVISAIGGPEILSGSLSNMIGDIKLSSGDFGNISKNLTLLKVTLKKLSENNPQLTHEERARNLKVLAVAPKIIEEICNALDKTYVSNKEMQTTKAVSPEEIKRAIERTAAHITALNEFTKLLSPAIEKAKGELREK